jgi:hypothetical protein
MPLQLCSNLQENILLMILVPIDNNSQIRIMYSRNGARPEINSLLCQFYIFLAYHKIMEINQQQKIESREQNRHNISENNRSIIWIENLLLVSIADHRKFLVWRIFEPRR